MQEINYEVLGRNIRSQRVQKGFRQRQFAEMLGVVPAHISHIETGNAKPSLELLVNIANLLEIDVNVLLLENLNAAKASILKIQIQELLDGLPPEFLNHILGIVVMEKEYYGRRMEPT